MNKFLILKIILFWTLSVPGEGSRHSPFRHYWPPSSRNATTSSSSSSSTTGL